LAEIFEQMMENTHSTASGRLDQAQAKGRILLLFPPTNYQIKGSVEGTGSRRSKALTPSLGLLYVARVLMDSGYHVRVHDFTAQEYDLDVLAELLRDTDLVGITLQSFNRDSVTNVIAGIKSINSECPIMIGGPDCILHPRLVPDSDVTVVSECETTIEEIVDSILHNRDLSNCKGIYYRENGSIKEGKPAQLNTDLDSIHIPAREIVDHKGYTFAGKRFTPQLATIVTTRGCPFRCIYCARDLMDRYRERSVENVLDEIEEIYRMGYRYLAIVDEEFLFKIERVKEIMRGIVERKIKMKYLVQGRVDSVDDEMFRLMKEAGVRMVLFGFESGNQDTLDFYRKKTTVEQNALAAKLATKHDMFVFSFFMLGAPMETEEHLRKTIDFSMSMPLDGVMYNVLDYTYGSELWRKAHEQGLIAADEFNVPADKERGLGNFTKEELDALCQEAFGRFYRRPSLYFRYIKKMLRIREAWTVQLAAGLGSTYFQDLRN